MEIFRSFRRRCGFRFYGWKLLVAYRALVFRPLQTGVTRHRFCAVAQPCQSTFEQCLPTWGTERPGGSLTLAIACA